MNTLRCEFRRAGRCWVPFVSRNCWNAAHSRCIRRNASNTWQLRALSESASAQVPEQPQDTSSSGNLLEEPSIGVASHIPVLLEEVLSFFEDRQLRTFVDGTMGAGGHSAALLSAHPEMQTFVGIDVDPTAHEIASARLSALKQQQEIPCDLLFAQHNYSQMGAAMQSLTGDQAADGILLDLGVSSMQLDSAERGFSISRDGPLDMRMGPGTAASAEHIVNSWPETMLANMFREYGEERHSRAYAARLVDARAKAPIRTTGQLVAALGSIGKRQGRRIHPATRVFQALRIAVNRELEHLQAAIPECLQCLAPGGRLAVITFHSLEDRLVKRAFLTASGRGSGDGAAIGPPAPEPPVLGRVLTKKPVCPSPEEEKRNPRSRSAKLRVFERTSL